MSVSTWDWFAWIKNNWLYLAVAAGGFAAGWLVKALDPPEVNAPEEYKDLAEKTVQGWRQKGYPESLIDKAMKWARDWSVNLANALAPDPSMAGELADMIYPKALQYAGKWLEAMGGK